MACVADAHADVTENTGPVTPQDMAIREAAALGMSLGIANGSARAAPSRCHRWASRSWVVSPPMPVPMIMAVRGPSTEHISPARSKASYVAARANCTNGSVVLGSSTGWKFCTLAAMGERSSLEKLSSRATMPERPSRSACQRPIEPQHGAATAPSPVTATSVGGSLIHRPLHLIAFGNQILYQCGNITNCL